MKTYQQIQNEVGAWASANFGDNESPYFVLKMKPFPEGWQPGNQMPDTLVALESLCPLLGIIEEIGELAAAVDQYKIEDAVGDIFIYICDYAYRVGIDIETLSGTLHTRATSAEDPFKRLVECAGKLCHGTLKRHEGIRGFTDDTKYRNHCEWCVAELLVCLEHYATVSGIDLLATVNSVWCDVSQRDWKRSPIDGSARDPRND